MKDNIDYEKEVKAMYSNAHCQIGHNLSGTVYCITNVENGNTILSSTSCKTKNDAWKSAYNNLTNTDK